MGTIGGGFTGLSTALHLVERGVDVAVLEAHEPGWGASGRNGGQVNPGLKHDPDTVEKDFGSDLGRRMAALSGNAPSVVFDLVQRHQIDCQALQSGTLRAGISPRDAAGIRTTEAQWARRDAPVAWLDGAALRQTTGTARYAGALLDRRSGQVNPLGYARGLAQRDIVAPHELRYLSDYALRLFPALRNIAWTHAWSGQLAVTPDHYPHIHEPHDDVLVFLGYNGRGVAMSTAMGPQLAQRIIGGRAAEFDMPVTTLRKIPFHALWRSAVTARMIHGRIRDWLGL